MFIFSKVKNKFKIQVMMCKQSSTNADSSGGVVFWKKQWVRVQQSGSQQWPGIAGSSVRQESGDNE